MIASIPRSSQHATPLASPTTSPSYYVPLPRRLLEDCQRTPQAIGVYAIIARLYRIVRAPVPLSPADLHAYDPRLSPTMALRALQRLKARGYLLAAERPGRKTSYAPAWGLVRGAPRAWCLDAPGLGRPGHIEHVRLDQRLLDTCLGRLRPHPDHPAQVERYLTAPLLSLHAVGAYACALVGLPAGCPILTQIGLLVDGRAVPLPDDATILAIASQRALGEQGEALTDAGWRRTPWAGAAPETPVSGSALFFVPPDRIGQGGGQPIGDPITRVEHAGGRSSAAGCNTGGPAAAPALEHGSMNLNDQDEIPTPPLTHAGANQVGGGDMHLPEGTVQALPTPELISVSVPSAAQAVPTGGTLTHPTAATGTRAASRRPARAPGDDGDMSCANAPSAQASDEPEVFRRLRAIGVRQDIARGLAALPPEQVERVIAQARSRPGVRDIAAWVVSALRALPAEPVSAAPPLKVSDLAILTHPGLSNHERVRWLTRFRSADLADRPAVLARFQAEHPSDG